MSWMKNVYFKKRKMNRNVFEMNRKNFFIGTACYAIMRPLLVFSELCQGKQKKERAFNIQKK